MSVINSEMQFLLLSFLASHLSLQKAILLRWFQKSCEKQLLASSCLSGWLSTWNYSSSHWTDFHDIWCSNIFRKSVEKIQVLLKSNKNDRYLSWRPMYIYDFQAKVLEIINTHIFYSITFSWQLCRLWDNVEKYSRIRQVTDDDAHAGYLRLQTHS